MLWCQLYFHMCLRCASQINVLLQTRVDLVNKYYCCSDNKWTAGGACRAVPGETADCTSPARSPCGHQSIQETPGVLGDMLDISTRALDIVPHVFNSSNGSSSSPLCGLVRQPLMGNVARIFLNTFLIEVVLEVQYFASHVFAMF